MIIDIKKKLINQLSEDKYLWDKLQVVMLVKYIEVEDEAYWILLRDVPEPNQENQSFTIRIPKDNRISSIDWGGIHDVVRQVTDGKLATRPRNRIGRW